MHTLKTFLICCCLFGANASYLHAQDSCTLSLSGKVVCSGTHETLTYAIIYIRESKKGAATDEKGMFLIPKICPGKYSVQVHQMGHRTLDTLISISGNTHVVFDLPPDDTHLKEISVESHQVKKEEVETVHKSELSGEQLQQTRGENLGDALKEIAGVDVIQSGATITKPVIHGLHSNRILILNNGVRQEGQQWGDDHAPEIDPFIATKLSVIKGAASIRYGSDAIGGVVLVEPAELPKEKCMNGELNIVGMDNSRLFAGSGILQGAFDNKLSGLSYRIQGTYRQAGNIETPDYILDNTGLLEKNYSGALAYKKEYCGLNVYYSHFHSKLGIFTYSEASNPAQLLQLFQEPAPTNFPLSYYLQKGIYKINRGYQAVSHNLLKATAYVKYGALGKLEATFARQTDSRQEYDLDVPYSINGSLDNAPQNNFDLTTHTAELIWEHNSWHHISGSLGASFITEGNVYTGLTYGALIPNYRNYGGGLFLIEKWNPNDKFTLEAGIRSDYKWQREYMLNPASLLEYTNTQQYNATTATIGASYRFTPAVSLSMNAGNGWRAPSAFELYAFGVHGATGQFVVGDSTLKLEQSYNFCSSLLYAGSKLEAELGAYVNVIDNYIYLKPTLTTHINIDGYFPVFDYTQTNALFKGIDLDLKWHITPQLLYEPKATLIYANDLTTHGYLVLIPPQRFQNKLEYRWKKLAGLRNVFVSAGNLLVPTQTRVPPNSDFVPPPKGYVLFSASVGCSVKVRNQDISFSIICNNLLNTVYRDYMDFFRYYADEPGRSVQLKVRIPFQFFPTKTTQTSTH
jgi:iron complex outermembrane receptor protein